MSKQSEITGILAEKRTVLIVDDDHDFAEGLVDILEPRGYNILEAHSINEALDKTENGRIELALLDIRLGEFNDYIHL